nr:MAG TPA: hypothetical protein [Caudoviricetes sp.]
MISLDSSQCHFSSFIERRDFFMKIVRPICCGMDGD